MDMHSRGQYLDRVNGNGSSTCCSQSWLYSLLGWRCPRLIQNWMTARCRSSTRTPGRCFRELLAQRLGSDVPDPESHAPAILANDLAVLCVAMKEGLLSIPEQAGRVPAFVIWIWTF